MFRTNAFVRVHGGETACISPSVRATPERKPHLTVGYFFSRNPNISTRRKTALSFLRDVTHHTPLRERYLFHTDRLWRVLPCGIVYYLLFSDY